MAVDKWLAPAPNVSSVAAVRKLKVCEFCKHLSSRDDMVMFAPAGTVPGREKEADLYAHGYCLVTKCPAGEDRFADLPSSEIGKVTLEEVLALGWDVDYALELMTEAEEREAELLAEKSGLSSKEKI